MKSQSYLQSMARQAKEYRDKQAKAASVDYLPEMVSRYAEGAAKLETKILAATTGQPTSVCPHCFNTDDDDKHELMGESDGAMLIQCVCGQTYLATPKKITVWTTRPYPPDAQ